jgi:hypothetical protein
MNNRDSQQCHGQATAVAPDMKEDIILLKASTYSLLCDLPVEAFQADMPVMLTVTCLL